MPRLFLAESLAAPGVAAAILGAPLEGFSPRAARAGGGRGVLIDAGEEQVARLRWLLRCAGGDVAEAQVETDGGAAPALAAMGAGVEGEPEAVRAARAREAMALREEGHEASGALWTGLTFRAVQRVRAAEEKQPPLLTDLGAGDVADLSVRRPHAGYFIMEQRRVSHALFGEGRSQEAEREVFVMGDAVTVLPYDPRADSVLLVAQFRAGPHARGDARPWPTEVIAGRIDAGETAEEVARREAREEAGLKLGRMEKVCAFYPSPGAVAEQVESFVGEADLGEAGGVHGLESESEDILSRVLGFQEAMRLFESGGVNTAPAAMSLLWLALNRDRLRHVWA